MRQTIDDEDVNELTAHYSCGYRDGHSDGFAYGFETGQKQAIDVLADIEKRLLAAVAQKLAGNNVDRVDHTLRDFSKNGTADPEFTRQEFKTAMQDKSPEAKAAPSATIPKGLTSAQVGAFKFIAENPGCSTKDTKQAGWNSTSVLYRLIAAGHIHRRPVPSSRYVAFFVDETEADRHHAQWKANQR